MFMFSSLADSELSVIGGKHCQYGHHPFARPSFVSRVLGHMVHAFYRVRFVFSESRPHDPRASHGGLSEYLGRLLTYHGYGRARSIRPTMVFLCPRCRSDDVQMCLPVWVSACSDVHDVSQWTTWSIHRGSMGQGWCNRCERHVLIHSRRLRLSEEGSQGPDGSVTTFSDRTMDTPYESPGPMRRLCKCPHCKQYLPRLKYPLWVLPNQIGDRRSWFLDTSVRPERERWAGQCSCPGKGRLMREFPEVFA